MSKWIYDGYTKVHDNSRRHMIERWCYRCSECGHTVRTEPKRTAIMTYTICPNCGADMRPKLVGKHADVTIIDEACMKGADDETD